MNGERHETVPFGASTGRAQQIRYVQCAPYRPSWRAYCMNRNRPRAGIQLERQRMLDSLRQVMATLRRFDAALTRARLSRTTGPIESILLPGSTDPEADAIHAPAALAIAVIAINRRCVRELLTLRWS